MGEDDNPTPPAGTNTNELEQKEFLVSEGMSDGPSGLMGTMADGMPPLSAYPELPVMSEEMAAMPDMPDLSMSTETPGEMPPLPTPEEGSLNQDLSIDDMLSAAIAGAGGEPGEAVSPLPEPSAIPTFQVRFDGLSEADRQRLKKAMDAQGISSADKSWSGVCPVISQLSEYQAILLLQSCRALGIQGFGSMDMPPPASPTEDDLALGDLLAAAELTPPTVDTAPSVVLPKGEKDVLLCTPDNLPGSAVRETFGIVLAHRSIARRLFREEDMREKLERELKSVPGRAAMNLASSHFQVLLRDLLLDLRKSALAKGGNSVLGVKLEAFPESSTTDPQLEQLRLVAFGTAAVVEKT